MHRSLCLLVFLLAACGAEKGDEQVCDSSPKYVNSDASQRLSALFIIRDVRELRKQVESSSFSSGFWGSTLQGIPGTRAAETAAAIKHLRWEMANQKAQEMALMMGGKSGLPSNARWACDVLASSIAAVDTGLSRSALLENLQTVETHFRRIYKIYGGKNLERDLQQL
jgi:hypothetical protein